MPVYWSADGKPGGTATIDTILPGRGAKKEFYVNFAVAGEHLIQAHLSADAVDVDNQRYAVVDLPVATPVLLVDGPRAAGNAKRIGDALTARKGIQPEIVSADYFPPEEAARRFCHDLRDELRQDRAPGRRGPGEIRQSGRRRVLRHRTVDPRRLCDPRSYRNGKGLFPLPLTGPEPLVVDPLDNTPDVQSEEHYVFRNMEHRVENLSKIFVQQYFSVPAIERQARSCRAGDQRSPARRPAAGGEGLRPWAVVAFLSTTSTTRASGTTGPLNRVPSWPLCSIWFRTSRIALGRATRCWWANRRRSRSAIRLSSPPSIFPVREAMPSAAAINGGVLRHGTADRDLHEDGDGRFLQGPAGRSRRTRRKPRHFAVNVDRGKAICCGAHRSQPCPPARPPKIDEFEYAANYNSEC